ncbi:MAG: transporter substrate-binding domain-containing protein [Eubacteriales bacterium]|nr:transporter substrate-binding domain-containing protein [Eubacteriales bacterium]
MKVKKALISMLLVCGIIMTACGASKAAGAAKGTGKYLKVGVRENLNKFSVYNEDADTFYGFEADVARQLALELGFDGVSYVGVVADDREAALADGSADCIIAAYSWTADRAEKYELSEPYFYDSGRVMIEKSTLFTDYKDLEGCRVAVHSGTSAAGALAKKLKNDGLINADSDAELKKFLNIVEYSSYDEMNAALETGEVDALCADGCISLPWMNDERTYFKEAYSEENYCIAANKGSALISDVNAAIGTLKENGTIDRLIAKWDLGEQTDGEK